MGKSDHRGAGIKHFLLAALFVVLVIAAGVWTLRAWYSTNLKPLSSSTTSTDFTVKSGQSVHQIGTNLQDQHLIRSGKAFETYVRSNELPDKLQAGTYVLAPNMSIQR